MAAVLPGVPEFPPNNKVHEDRNGGVANPLDRPLQLRNKKAPVFRCGAHQDRQVEFPEPDERLQDLRHLGKAHAFPVAEVVDSAELDQIRGRDIRDLRQERPKGYAQRRQAA